ncbi:hypothetical protein [Hyphomicrobium methylovorum]|uniref:hypothetical protein n=1 Tax=Hyphomicrobium methylovorum TaxID=84 RepID=UPI0031B58714
MNEVSNVQRAIWMTLITSLATPLFASLLFMALGLARPFTDFMLQSTEGLPIGEAAVDVFTWAALPSTVAGIGLSPFVLQHGGYTWLHAAVGGVLAFMASAIIFPIDAGGAMPLLAFLAGLIAIGMRQLLIAIGIILDRSGP